jgi:hypothetical protein
MPGLVPGIHVLLHLKSGKTWMAGTGPAMTKGNSFSSGSKEPENAGCLSVRLRMKSPD